MPASPPLASDPWDDPRFTDLARRVLALEGRFERIDQAAEERERRRVKREKTIQRWAYIIAAGVGSQLLTELLRFWQSGSF